MVDELKNIKSDNSNLNKERNEFAKYNKELLNLKNKLSNERNEAIEKFALASSTTEALQREIDNLNKQIEKEA